MSKASAFPNLLPAVGSFNLKGKTLWELYRAQEKNAHSMELLKIWLDDLDCPISYGYWKCFDNLRKKINRAIYLKRFQNYLLSLIGR